MVGLVGPEPLPLLYKDDREGNGGTRRSGERMAGACVVCSGGKAARLVKKLRHGVGGAGCAALGIRHGECHAVVARTWNVPCATNTS